MSTPSSAPDPRNRPLRVFLCHSSGDKAFVRDLYRRLKDDGFQPWLDEIDLIPGQEWQEEIPIAVRASDVVVVCLSQSVSKEGYLQKEIRDALSVAEEKPEGAIFIIPVKIEEVEVPRRLSRWQWANLFEKDGYQRLLVALNRRADTIGRVVPPDVSRKKVAGDESDTERQDVIARVFEVPALVDTEPIGPPIWLRIIIWVKRRWQWAVISFLLVGSVPVLAWYFLAHSTYRVRIAVLNELGEPTNKAQLTCSLGEIKNVGGVWECDVPAKTTPADRKLQIYAEIPGGNLTGRTEVFLADDYSPKATIRLSQVLPQTARLSITLKGHDAWLWSATFSPDGQKIVTASEDGMARVWHSSNGELLFTMRGHASIIRNAAFSPDGRLIVTASYDKTARVWDANTGHQLLTLEGHTGLVRTAAFSPNGQRIVTASDDKTARVWDTATGKVLFALRGHSIAVLSAAFSPDGRLIVTTSHDKTARVWDTTTGHPLLTLEGHTDSVETAAFSVDSQRIVTASGDHTARLWNAANGQEILTLQGHTLEVWSAAFSPDGRLIVTAGQDMTARVWNAANAQLLVTLQHRGAVNDAAFSPDGKRIVTACDDHTAKVWELVY